MSSMINIDEQVIRQFNSILLEAKTDKTWCNEYHLLAISTFLNSDIYICSMQSADLWQSTDFYTICR